MQGEGEHLESQRGKSYSGTIVCKSHEVILMAPSCPHVLRFDAHVKGCQCHSTSVLLGPGATQGPGQEYSSDQSEQCCTRSRQRLLGIQSQYLKTVEGQRHHPGPQGGHAVTRGTRADKRAAVVPWNALGTPSSHTCHRSPEPHPI